MAGPSCDPLRPSRSFVFGLVDTSCNKKKSLLLVVFHEPPEHREQHIVYMHGGASILLLKRNTMAPWILTNKATTC